MKFRAALAGVLGLAICLLVACQNAEEVPEAVEPAPVATATPVEPVESASEPTDQAESVAATTPAAEPDTATQVPPEVDSAYPAPGAETSQPDGGAPAPAGPQDAYPAPAAAASAAPDNAYPAPQPSVIFDSSEAKFSIAGPVKAGSTSVTGTGPRGVDIQIYDITNREGPLGSAIIDDDGNYTVTLDRPLELDHLIGIQIASRPPDVPMMEYVTALIPFAGTNAMDIPLQDVGIVWDTATVGPP